MRSGQTLPLIFTLLLPAVSHAAPAPTTSSPPAASKPAAATNAPGSAATNPASGSSTTPAAAAANAPAGAATTPAAPATTDRVLVKLPAAGSYLAWVEGRGGTAAAASTPVSFTGAESSLALPSATGGVTTWRVCLLDQKTGYSAVREVPAKAEGAREITFAATDFNRVHRVRVQVTGTGGKPVASGTVTLTGKDGSATSRVLDPSALGTVEFTDVPSGTAQLAVAPTGAGSTTKEVQIALAPGEAAQTIAIALPEVTAVVESAPAAGTTAAAPPSTTPGGGNSSNATPLPPAGPSATPSEQLPAPSGGSPLTPILGFLILAGAGYALYVTGRNRGWTLDKALARLGIQPAAAPDAGPASLRPAPAPAAPVDPNVCQFCGQRKDPVTGACACSLDAAAPAAPSPSLFGAAAAPGSGPRLVAMQGAYMGQIYPLTGEATIGRDLSNSIAMENDNTVSRRHARLTPADGGYRIEDTGSSNGIYVNGARVTEAVLRPGDDVSIGGTRFRFEI